jgi:hypothetical protein
VIRSCGSAKARCRDGAPQYRPDAFDRVEVQCVGRELVDGEQSRSVMYRRIPAVKWVVKLSQILSGHMGTTSSVGMGTGVGLFVAGMYSTVLRDFR